MLRALKTLWPMRFPEKMAKAKATEIVDFLEEHFVEFAGDTVVQACQKFALENDNVPSWAAIKQEAEKVKAQRRMPSQKRAKRICTDPEGWMYVIYDDGDSDWIYDGSTHKWRNRSCQEKVERILNDPSMEPWARRYFPKWASEKFMSGYQAPAEKQLSMNREPELEDEIGVEDW